MWRKVALERLRKAGYKITPQRLKLLDVLERIGRSHPSLREVHEAVKEEFPTISFSTLYSNVMVLRDLGLVELLHLGSETRVEVNVSPHVNVISGRRVRDLDDPELVREIERKVGGRVRFVNVVLEDEV